MNHELIDKNLIVQTLMHDAPWSGSHGAWDDYLGMGLFYYSIVYMLKAKVAVCLGSGGGFVPRLMRQAQRDLGIADTSRTILVDGNNPAAGWGSPVWLSPSSFFRQQFPDVELLIDLTSNAQPFFSDNQISIDYLHIDADHHYEGVKIDWDLYSTLVPDDGLITLHDTVNYRKPCGVPQLIEEIRQDGRYAVINFAIRYGTALVKKNPAARPQA